MRDGLRTDEGAAMAQFGTAATKQFIQTSTQIVTQVINEKSDRIEAFTDIYGKS